MLLMLLAVGCMACGCDKKGYEIKNIEAEEYVLSDYACAVVHRGDLTPTFDISLMQENIATITYGVSNEDLVLDKLYVSVGDKVHDGQVMATFKANDIEEKLLSTRKDIEDITLHIEHLQRLMQANSKADYSNQIESLKRKIEVDELYISEYEEKLDGYRIIATTNGTVTFINSDLQNGFLTEIRSLIKVASGNGKYTARTSESYDFKVGDILTAVEEDMEYEMKIVSVEKEALNSGVEYTILYFEPLIDISAVSDNAKFSIKISKDTVKQVLYVDKKAVKYGNNCTYVLLKNRLGLIEKRIVETGDKIDDYIIINSGLEGDEEVIMS